MSGNPQPGGPPQLGLSMRFHVQVDDTNLGNWSKVSGLDVKAKLTKKRDHGNYAFEYIVFADVEYTTVKLERAMDKASSAAVRAWLKRKLEPWQQPGVLPTTIGASTATITLLDGTWTDVCEWTLRGVYPSGWYGPTFAAGTSAIAIERLELDHEGFL